MKEKRKKNIIPIGIFFVIFFLMLILSTAISTAYFYFEARSRISEIELYTRGYSIPLAEAFADVAELGLKNNNIELIKRLFHEKIQDNIIDEAFFVLSDGTIIVHSDKEIEKELKGNIATDEFAYNLDLIMLPIWTKVDHAQFMDYSIYNDSKRLRLKKQVIKFLKNYFYPKIDVTGWLVTQAVRYNNKNAGCISFIISKERIYKFLYDHFDKTFKLAISLSIASFILSFFVSIIVFIRYRSINKKNIAYENISGIDGEEEIDLNDKKPKEAIKIKSGSERVKHFFSTGKKLIKEAIAVKNK